MSGYISYTHTSPVSTSAMLVQSESSVYFNENAYDNSGLNTIDATGAYLGINATGKVDVGIVESLGLTIASELEAFEAANVTSSGISTLTNEEFTLSLGVTEYNVKLLEIAMANATYTEVQDLVGPPVYTEGVFMIGGACTAKQRPFEISVSNIACNAPTGDTDVATGVQGVLITIYDALCTTGLTWDDINANSINTLDLEFAAQAVSSFATGNKLGSVLVY